MGDELKPCPFCGGEARIHSKVLAEGFDSGYWAVCDECGKGDTLPHESEEEAAAAWNARAAVADEQFSLAVNDGEAWQKVRTCGQPRGFIPCDSDSFGSMSFAELWCEHCDIELDPEWQFCPSCGAKIEGESR